MACLVEGTSICWLTWRVLQKLSSHSFLHYAHHVRQYIANSSKRCNLRWGKTTDYTVLCPVALVWNSLHGGGVFLSSFLLFHSYTDDDWFWDGTRGAVSCQRGRNDNWWEPVCVCHVLLGSSTGSEIFWRSTVVVQNCQVGSDDSISIDHNITITISWWLWDILSHTNS